MLPRSTELRYAESRPVVPSVKWTGPPSSSPAMEKTSLYVSPGDWWMPASKPYSYDSVPLDGAT